MKRWSVSVIRGLSCALAIGLVLAALTGCGSRAAADNLIKVTEAENGTSVTLKKGDTLEVTLEGNPSTGFNWLVAASADGVVRQRGEAEVVDAKAADRAGSTIVGASQLMALTFDAVATGSGALVLEYKRSWETTVPAEKTYTLNVIVN